MTERTAVLEDVDFAPAKAAEPSRRWRNWSLAIGAGVYVCPRCDVHVAVRDGEVSPNHCKVFPSKDSAETAALRDLQCPVRASEWEYLGAFPEGERP